MVKQAYCAGRLSPEINISSLSGAVQRPTILEIQQVLELRHLVLCLEFIFDKTLPAGTAWGMNFRESCPPSTAIDKEIWTKNFHGTIYRFLLAGAYLTRAYTEPFHTATSGGPSDFMKVFIEKCNLYDQRNESHDEEESLPSLEESDYQYLKRFPVYNSNSFSSLDRSFDHLSTWLLDQTQARINDLPEDGPVATHEYYDTIPEVVQVREILQILFIYCQLCNDLQDNKFIFNSNGQGGYSRSPMTRLLDRLRPHSNPRKVTVIILGVFQPEEISMPAEIPTTYPDLQDTYAISSVRLMADRIPRDDLSTDLPPLPDISLVLRSISSFDRIDFQPPPQFFNFTFERYFALKFSHDILVVDVSMVPNHEAAYRLFNTHGEIFHKEYFRGIRQLLVDVDPNIEI